MTCSIENVCTGAGPKKWGAFEMGCCGGFGWLVGLGWFGCCLSFFLGGGGGAGVGGGMCWGLMSFYWLGFLQVTNHRASPPVLSTRPGC